MFLLNSFLALGLLSGVAQAQGLENVNCYDMDSLSPINTKAQQLSPEKETWCYWYPEDTEGKVLFSIESGTVRPELSALIKENGDITFGSLLKGQVAAFTINDTESPFNAPLEEPTDMIPNQDVITPEIMDSAQKILDDFKQAPTLLLPQTLRPGRHQASVSRAVMPWSGYWWPYSNRALVNPLKKYDRFVAARTGQHPGAADWEARNHSANVDWYGHCNGWAASSVIRPEPTMARRDPETGIVFSISDQKGLWAEDDHCIRARFIGRRNDGDGNPNDIHPALFHKTLTQHIDGMGKPVLMDYDRSTVVFHNVISGYEMDIRRVGPNAIRVRMIVTAHKFDDNLSDRAGIAEIVRRPYQYILKFDSSGRVADGRWLSGNPDFLWIPQSPASCDPTNPAVETKWIKEITQLPTY